MVLVLCFVLVHLSYLDRSLLSDFFLLLFLCSFLPLSRAFCRHTSGKYLCKAPRMLFETICQLCKTESWRWIPEVEVTPFIRQFIRGTCQGQLLQIRRRARQIRITKTETCLLKWSLRLCFCLTSSPRAGLTAHRLPLIECDRFSHYVNWQLVLITTCHTRSEILWHNFWSQLQKPQSLSKYQHCENTPDLSVVSFHHVMLTACAVPMCHY